MDDDELTVSSHASMDEIRRMVAEAQASMNSGVGRTAQAESQDDEATVEADAWVLEQIRSGLQVRSHDDDDFTLATAPAGPPAASEFEPPADDTLQRRDLVVPMPPPASPVRAHAPHTPSLEQGFRAPTAPLVERPLVIEASVIESPPVPPTPQQTSADPASLSHPRGDRWQPPARLVNPREREGPAPHQQISRWKLVSAGLGVLLVATIVVALFATLGGDEVPPDDTTVDGSSPVSVVDSVVESGLGG